jgi:hypothetical protein
VRLFLDRSLRRPSHAATAKAVVRSWRPFPACLSLGALLFLLAPRAHAGATLLLAEPYSYDGALAGTGHSAVYLDRVCAVSPVELRLCSPGETGVVLSRYNRIGGYDWIAIPLTPYLYAVEGQEDAPMFADAKLVAFLRDQYRRKHLESLVPDGPGGETPPGDWYELVGASYDRTIYGFVIETTPEQDARLIAHLNGRANRKRFSLVANNCADFAREIIDFYYPHAVHRSVFGDLGVTTPKQISKNLQQYGRRHPELASTNFIIPQVPGTLRRSKPVHGVLESVFSAKKYMLPLLVLHPYISGSVLAAYFGHRRFNPAKNAPVLDSEWRLDTPLTPANRRSYQNQLEEIRSGSISSLPGEAKSWEHMQSAAEIKLDSFGKPVMQIVRAGAVEEVGMTRANVLNAPGSPDLAAKLVEARLQLELRPGAAHKTANSDVAADLSLLRHLLSLNSEKRVTSATASSAPENTRPGSGDQR